MKVLDYPFDSSYIMKNKIKLRNKLLNDGSNRIHVRIAVLGGSTTYDICTCLQLFLLNQGIEPIFYESEYNKYWEEAMFLNKKLSDFRPDIIYIHTSSRNVTVEIKKTDTFQNIAKKLDEEYRRFEEMWENLRKEYHCLIIQNNFERSLIRIYGNKDISDIHGFSNFIYRLNNKFYEFSQKVTWLYVNDIDYMSSVYGLDKWNDFSAWYMYKYIMAIDAIPEYSYNLSNIIKSIYGRDKKVLSVDLDDTLWGGAISDEGLKGIELGMETAVGEMYIEIQKYIKKQKEKGVVLTVNSKNDISNVELAFSHPDMQLSINDFSVIKANWENKDNNIFSTAEKLQVGLDSIVFLDDNPVERNLVKEQLPDVSVLESDAPERFIKILDRAGYFEMTNLSDEDQRRTELYKAKEKCDLERKKYRDYDEFLKSLKMECSIQKITEENLQRVAQLVNKSNQFNLTVKRLNESEIQKFIYNRKYICLCGRLKDKFTDNGIVSVLIAERRNKDIYIELFVMSCRVLKRGMEEAMLDELFRMYDLIKYERIIGYYNRTEKNAMVENFYRNMGFRLWKESEDTKVFVIDPKEYKFKNKNIKVLK